MKHFSTCHYVWLAKHPERSEDWLKRMLGMGFDIHHVDGDRENNDPSNLVLIERKDHRDFHTRVQRMEYSKPRERRAPPNLSELIRDHKLNALGRMNRPELCGKTLCREFLETDKTWSQIAAPYYATANEAMNAAHEYADANGLDLIR